MSFDKLKLPILLLGPLLGAAVAYAGATAVVKDHVEQLAKAHDEDRAEQRKHDQRIQRLEDTLRAGRRGNPAAPALTDAA